MKTYDICIVGMGFVGGAVANAFKTEREYGLSGFKTSTLTKVDPKLDFPIENIAGRKFDAIFICVPTPSNNDGTIDSSIVDSVLNFIEKNVETEVIVLKSTLTPDLVDFYCKNPKVVYNPEFLTERRANDDFIRAEFHVIGSNSRSTGLFLENIYKETFGLRGDAIYFHVKPAEASFIKYAINSFLATKVAWFNQLFDLVESYDENLDFNVITSVMKHDERIGTTHMKVPGWDGNRGFGGACFPKDIPALIHFGSALESSPSILKEAWNYNVGLRTGGFELLEREVVQNIQFKRID